MRLTFATAAAFAAVLGAGMAPRRAQLVRPGSAGRPSAAGWTRRHPDIEGRTGWNLGAAAGRDFGNGVRVESEVIHLSADARHGRSGKDRDNRRLRQRLL
jgi:hypothetical protein